VTDDLGLREFGERCGHAPDEIGGEHPLRIDLGHVVLGQARTAATCGTPLEDERFFEDDTSATGGSPNLFSHGQRV